jgi:hypothetical protein
MAALRESPGLGKLHRLNGALTMTHIKTFPLIALVIAAYLLMALGGSMLIDADAWAMTMPSGAELTLRGGDLYVIAGLVALFVDLVNGGGSRATRVLLAGVIAAIAVICLAFVGFAGTATFLTLTIMALVVAVARALGARP